MVITIKDENQRFGVRVAAIIYNKDMSKIFVQEQAKDFYVLPGGRLEVCEESKIAIQRELIEELNIREDAKLKYIAENFILLPNKKKYHEIGFYYVLTIDAEKYGYKENNEYKNLDAEHDGDSSFKWVNIEDIEKYNIMPNNIIQKIKNKEITIDDTVEHLIYKEYESL